MEDMKINLSALVVKIKLSALWVAAMFCYLYADVLVLLVPGILEELVAGEVGGMQITQAFLYASALIMVPPIVMIFLSLTLSYPVNRWANIILGIVYTGIILGMLLMDPSVPYLVYGSVEVVLTALIVWYAWKWSKPEI
ncbi:MAG: DUF6326 family protein [Candidatus Hodarchaeota archaeon]